MAIHAITVLLCDDHAMVRLGFRQLLETVPDIEVLFEAESGEEAYQIYRKTPTNIIIMDISMPGMGGLAAARHILEYDHNAKIIMLTMHDSHTFISRALKLGIKGYLTKRGEPDELVKAVRQVDRGRCYIEPSLAHDMAIANITGSQDPIDILSPREFEVFSALSDGVSVNDNSSIIHLSTKKVGVHRTKVMKKLHIDNLSDMTRLAIRHGVIEA
ncbi:MAG: response regulator [Mariprofundaceae bacterium]|nr:response regulator [Mariprofundaceae bacterium]